MSKIYQGKCRHCGKIYKGRGKFYCSHLCFLQDKGFQKGHKVPEEWRIVAGNYDHHNTKTPIYTLERNEKIKNSLMGKSSGTLGKHWRWSKESRAKITLGKSSKSAKILGSTDAKVWREKIFKRDNYTCQKCRKRGGELRAHHIINLSKILNLFNIKILEEAISCKELWDLNNGITFCKRCHDNFHRLFGRYNNSKEQLKQFLNQHEEKSESYRKKQNSPKI